MFFGNCPQNFRTFPRHLSKVAKAQNFALPSSDARVSSSFGLALVADQTSNGRFAFKRRMVDVPTLHSCNPQYFKYS